MAETKTLARFSALSAEGGYRLHIEDEDGETIEFEATREQLDVIADAIDELLSQDEEEDEIDDDEEAEILAEESQVR